MVICYILAEENTCLAVKQLLALKNMSSEDLVKNEENEKIRLLALVDKRSEFLSRKHVLADMEQILAQETEKFKETQKIQSQTVKGVLSQ